MDRIEAFLRMEIARHPHDLREHAVDRLGARLEHVDASIGKLLTGGEFEEFRAPDGRTGLRWRSALRAALVPGLEEDRLWREFLAPRLADVPQNVRRLLHYGATEMLNNVIDHSQGREVVAVIRRLPTEIELYVEDDGIGIFRKLQSELGLENPQHVALELSKGKLTTDPSRHTGEGIFFTSRMCDKFLIWSGSTSCGHVDGTVWHVVQSTSRPGTSVRMVVSLDSKNTPERVFEAFAPSGRERIFSKTALQVSLLRENGEDLLSRSQAKRLLARCEAFQEVTLDFQGVASVGPAFADEIFRVFARGNPDITLHVVNASDPVRAMIERAQANS